MKQTKETQRPIIITMYSVILVLYKSVASEDLIIGANNGLNPSRLGRHQRLELCCLRNLASDESGMFRSMLGRAGAGQPALSSSAPITAIPQPIAYTLCSARGLMSGASD